MGFIKRGDGKILTVVDTDDLDENTKKSAQEFSKTTNQSKVKPENKNKE